MKTIVMRTLTIIATVLIAAGSMAQVPVAILPFEGDEAGKSLLEMRIKEYFTKNGIAVITDASLKEIMKIHERAQTLGSAYHDISKLKVAEYIVKGSFTAARANLVVIDVNSATEVINLVANMGADREYGARKAAKDLCNSIIMHASSKKRELPKESVPYMDVVSKLVSSLGMGDQASYPYIAFYYDGRYQSPTEADKERIEKARLFLKVIRPAMVRSTLSFVAMEAKSPWVYITVIADKLGKKTKHKFGIIELDDGNLSVGLYELVP